MIYNVSGVQQSDSVIHIFSFSDSFQDSKFNVLIYANESVSNSSMDWWTKILIHWWPMFNEDKTPELQWHEIKKGIQRL